MTSATEYTGSEPVTITDPSKRTAWAPPGFTKGMCNSEAHKGKNIPARKGNAFYCDPCQDVRSASGATKTVTNKTAQTADTGQTTVKPPTGAAVGGTAANVASDMVDPKEKEALALKEKEARIKTAIVSEINPLLLQTFADLCKPADQENFYTVTVNGKNEDGSAKVVNIPTPHLGEQIIFGDMEATVLAKAAAKAAELPMFKATTAIANPYMGYAFMAAGVAVVAMKTTKLMTMRSQIVATATAQITGQAPAETVRPPEGQPAPPQPSAQARPSDQAPSPPGGVASRVAKPSGTNGQGDPAAANANGWGRASGASGEPEPVVGV